MPHAADLQNLVRDVQRAKQNADFVFVSLHWGIHFQPRVCDYQPIVAHAAIDAGANAILGHGPHQQQGIELYKGAVIFYSIGNFSLNISEYRRPGREGGSYCLPDMGYRHQEVYSIEPDPGFVFDYLNWTGKFVAGGVTQMKAAGDRYEVFARGGG